MKQRPALPKDCLATADTVTVFVEPLHIEGRKMAYGDEFRANNTWLPVRYTRVGVSDAVMDFSHMPPLRIFN